MMTSFGKLALDLSEQAAAGRFLPTIGRNAELARLGALIESGSARRIVLAGPPGVGKTALLQGVAQALCAAKSPARLLEVHPSTLNANTVMVREQLDALLNACENGNGVWAIVDEFSALVSTGAALNDGQRAFLSAVQTGSLRSVLAMRSELFLQLQQDRHPALDGAEIIELAPLDAASTTEILRQLKPALEEEIATLIAEPALVAAVALSQQYQPDQALPGTAIHLLGRASRRHRKKTELGETPPPWMDKSTMKHLGKAVGEHDVRRALDDLTGLDVTAIETEGWKQEIAAGLMAALPGREAGVLRLAAAVALVRQSMTKHGSASAAIVVAGPPGTRKTHAVQMLAQSLPGHPSGARLLDLSGIGAMDDLHRLAVAAPAPPPGTPKPLMVNVYKSLHKASPDLRRTLGRALVSPNPAEAFPWTAGYQRVLHLLTFDAADAFAVSTDLIRRTERLLDLDRGQLKAEAVYFAANPSAG